MFYDFVLKPKNGYRGPATHNTRSIGCEAPTHKKAYENDDICHFL